ncbi:unnamed protein product [Arctia plantaginis]|nr:unnamed protein product [Arctia plantaginis]
MKSNYLKELLGVLQGNKIYNLFLILGENYDSNTSEFESTSQLIKFIKKQTGSYFCIGVAGFPGCSEEKLVHLKEKIESGADYILTQAFFEKNTYKAFADQCERLNIKVPIIPGKIASTIFSTLESERCRFLINSSEKFVGTPEIVTGNV